MKTTIALSLFAALALAGCGDQKQTAASAAPPEQAAPAAIAAADPLAGALDELKTLSQTPPPEGISPIEHNLWFDRQCQAIGEKALAIYTGNPSDPRRWDAVMIMRRYQPRFYKSLVPVAGPDAEPVAEFDTAAAEAWRQRAEQLETALRSATDLTAAAREELDTRDTFAKLNEAYAGLMRDKKPVDLDEIRGIFEAFFARWPDSQSGGAVSYYVSFRKGMGKDDEIETLKTFFDSPNAAVRDYARTRVGFFEKIQKPLDIAYTAIDGREVDLKKLRGKVVLIDFWATWCGPCIAELPEMKKVHAAYHDKGFEIVGISLDSERDKQKLLKFIEKESMPWPQYFDGKGWQNKFAVEYAITGIPAMFLLDQEGKVVSTNARGGKLETEVRRLLGE
ncbi:TlpA family protein disulfide reductase [Termitidicoccus mucosus]